MQTLFCSSYFFHTLLIFPSYRKTKNLLFFSFFSQNYYICTSSKSRAKQCSETRTATKSLPVTELPTLYVLSIKLLKEIYRFYVKERNNPEWVSVATVSGQLKDVYLPDSTLVSMAGNSTLRYDVKKYGKERRVVEMTGKAFFQVKRNEARPFSVHTAMTEVTVLGTSFQVSEQPDMTEVDVVTGKVRFAAGKEPEPVILTAGMSASYSNEKKEIDILKEENLNNLSWKTKQLRFNDTPLEKVIRDLNEYYQVEIINKVDSPDSRLTATFNDLPLDEVLMVINQTLDIRLVPRKDK